MVHCIRCTAGQRWASSLAMGWRVLFIESEFRQFKWIKWFRKNSCGLWPVYWLYRAGFKLHFLHSQRYLMRIVYLPTYLANWLMCVSSGNSHCQFTVSYCFFFWFPLSPHLFPISFRFVVQPFFLEPGQSHISYILILDFSCHLYCALSLMRQSCRHSAHNTLTG